VKLYLHFSSTPLWRGAQLKHRDNFDSLVIWLDGGLDFDFMQVQNFAVRLHDQVNCGYYRAPTVSSGAKRAAHESYHLSPSGAEF